MPFGVLRLRHKANYLEYSFENRFAYLAYLYDLSSFSFSFQYTIPYDCENTAHNVITAVTNKSSRKKKIKQKTIEKRKMKRNERLVAHIEVKSLKSRLNSIRNTFLRAYMAPDRGWKKNSVPFYSLVSKCQWRKLFWAPILNSILFRPCCYLWNVGTCFNLNQ